MIIKCPNCGKQYKFNSDKYKGKKVNFICPSCKYKILIDLTTEKNKLNFPKKKLDINKIIDTLNDLPTLPQVVDRLIEAVDNPETTIKEINKIITTDQSLTAKTLKLVNSAYYGLNKNVKTVEEAIVIIGFDAIKNLAISASVFDIFKGFKQKSNFDREGFWKHSIAVAMTSRIISEELGIGKSGELFVSGLLHDIGKLIIDAYFPDVMNSILYHISVSQATFIEAEHDLIDIDHTQIGFRLGKKWNLPEELIYPIRFHHSPEITGTHNLNIAIIHIANIIAKYANIGYDGYDQIPKISSYAWREIKMASPGLTKSKLKEFIKKISEMADTQEFLDFS